MNYEIIRMYDYECLLNRMLYCPGNAEADLGGQCRGWAPFPPSPPPEMTYRFLIQLVFMSGHQSVTPFLSGAPLLKKILDPPRAVTGNTTAVQAVETVLSVRFEVSVSLLLAPTRADKRGPKAPFLLVENARIQPAIHKRVPAGAPVGAGSY